MYAVASRLTSTGRLLLRARSSSGCQSPDADRPCVVVKAEAGQISRSAPATFFESEKLSDSPGSLGRQEHCPVEPCVNCASRTRISQSAVTRRELYLPARQFQDISI